MKDVILTAITLTTKAADITVACECHVLHVCMARAAPASCQRLEINPLTGRWQPAQRSAHRAAYKFSRFR